MSHALSDQPIQRAFRATAGCFLVLGLLIPTMFAQFPLIREKLNLGEDQISWFLLVVGFGAIPSMAVSGYLIIRLGIRTIALTVFIPLLFFPPLFGLANTYPQLLLIGFGLGVCSGFFDVTSNTHGSLLERMTGRLFMTSIHAMFAAGLLMGGAFSFVAQYFGMPVPLLLGSLALVSSTLFFFLQRDFVSREIEAQFEETEAAASYKGAAWPRSSLLLLVGIGILMLLGIEAEAAHYDWMTLYYTTVFGAEGTPLDAQWGTLAYITFAVGLLILRLSGDWIAEKIGRPRLLLFSVGMGLVGLIWLITCPSYWFAVPAAFLMGGGFAPIFPIFAAAAGRIRGIKPSVGVAFVAAMGWGSVFIGPPIIGLVAEHFSYQLAYATLLPPALIVAIFGPWVVFKSRPGNH